MPWGANAVADATAAAPSSAAARAVGTHLRPAATPGAAVWSVRPSPSASPLPGAWLCPSRSPCPGSTASVSSLARVEVMRLGGGGPRSLPLSSAPAPSARPAASAASCSTLVTGAPPSSCPAGPPSAGARAAPSDVSPHSPDRVKLCVRRMGTSHPSLRCSLLPCTPARRALPYLSRSPSWPASASQADLAGAAPRCEGPSPDPGCGTSTALRRCRSEAKRSREAASSGWVRRRARSACSCCERSSLLSSLKGEGACTGSAPRPEASSDGGGSAWAWWVEGGGACVHGKVDCRTYFAAH